MARAVLPRISARAAWLLTGHTDLPPSSEFRLPPLDCDSPEQPSEDGLDEAQSAAGVDETSGDEENDGAGSAATAID